MTPKKMTPIEDRLSELPDPILTHILSFLSTKEAVQTILIRRLDTLWTDLPQLNLVDEDSSTYHGFFLFARNILTLHRRPTLEKFRVHIMTVFNSDIQRENMGHEVDSWLEFSLRKQAKYLEFGFGMVEPCEELYKLPYQDFISDSLAELKLVYIDLNKLRRVQMVSLQVLKLEWISLENNVLREFIRGCPLLIELDFYNCSGLTDIISENLEVLKIVQEIEDWDLLSINCPKLASFDYAGCVECLENINLPNQVKCHITPYSVYSFILN